MEVPFQFETESGSFTPRFITAEAAILALTPLMTLALRPEVPPPLLETFDGLVGEASALLKRLRPETDVAPTPDPPEEPQPVMTEEVPASVQALGPLEKLRTRRGVNELLDGRAAALGDILGGEAIEQDESGQAARLLHEVWFGQGRSFLTLSYKRQWLAFDARWGHIQAGSEVAQAIQTLRLGAKIEALRALNGWFGKLLRITAEELEQAAETPDDPLPEALELLTRLTCFAQVAWPRDTAEDARRRLELLGAYAQEIEAVSLRRAEVQRKAAAARKAAAGGGTTQPTSGET